MKELPLNLKIIGKVIFGFSAGLVGLTIILGIVAIIVFPESEVIKNELDNNYYYTHQTHGWATTSTVREIKIYENRKFWFDRKIADLSMYYNRENVYITVNDNIVNIWINFEIRVTHDLNEGTLKLTADEFWWTKDRG